MRSAGQGKETLLEILVTGRRNLTPAQQHREIEALIKSKGWFLLEQRMREEVALATNQLASLPSLPADELHWRRGAVWAANKLLQAPHLLKQQIETELALTSHNSPAKAGQKDKPNG